MTIPSWKFGPSKQLSYGNVSAQKGVWNASTLRLHSFRKKVTKTDISKRLHFAFVTILSRERWTNTVASSPLTSDCSDADPFATPLRTAGAWANSPEVWMSYHVGAKEQ
jgi:hypothetical protein